MKNLFDYATKELSQDAFLRWLFESWNEVEECGVIVGKLLKELCDFEVDIDRIETRAQEKDIDIRVNITTKEKQFIYVFIEDKTYSNEHKQLRKYDEYINTFPNSYKIFYKTSKITDDDKKGIDEANDINRKANKSEWQKWDIQKIVGLFDYKANYENLILQHYIEYIKKTYQTLFNYQSKPVCEWCKTYAIFTSYSERLIEKFSDVINPKNCRTAVYQGKYAETFIQKNLPNNITVELGLFFREWGTTAWVKVWDTDKEWNRPFSRMQELKNLILGKSKLDWENKKYKNRIKIIKKFFSKDLTYETFNDWMENCVQDYLAFSNKIATIPNLVQ